MLLRYILILMMVASAQAAPFGVVPHEPAFKPDGSWLGQVLGQMVQWQSQFHAQIIQYFSSVNSDSAAQFGLLLACFLYGFVHSIGPGHGKVVMASWLAAQRHARLNIAVAFAFIAAMAQALVAIAVIAIVFYVLNLTQAAIGQVIYSIDIIAGTLIALLGLRLLWRLISGLKTHHHHHAGCGCSGLTQGAKLKAHSYSELIITAVMAGLRPCTGALLVLTLAFSKGAAIWGILGVLLMGAGVSCGLLAMALLVIFAKGRMEIKADGGNAWMAYAVRILECCAALFLLFWGCAMVLATL